MSDERDAARDAAALLPCPFCGGEAESKQAEIMAYYVECVRCENGTKFRPTPQTAREAWNTRYDAAHADQSRPEPPEPDGDVEMSASGEAWFDGNGKWCPIETAPKDGTLIWCVWTEGFVLPRRARCRYTNGAWYDADNPIKYHDEPTYWRKGMAEQFKPTDPTAAEPDLVEDVAGWQTEVQAWCKYRDSQLGDWSDVLHSQSFKAGYSAAAQHVARAEVWVHRDQSEQCICGHTLSDHDALRLLPCGLASCPCLSFTPRTKVCGRCGHPDHEHYDTVDKIGCQHFESPYRPLCDCLKFAPAPTSPERRSGVSGEQINAIRHAAVDAERERIAGELQSLRLKAQEAAYEISFWESVGEYIEQLKEAE